MTTSKRASRYDAIRDIVRAGDVGTQRELARRLQEVGFDCTQATVSRDIAEMGLQKDAGGHYVHPQEIRLRQMVGELVESIDAAGNLVVMRTYPGAASGVAGAIDEAQVEGVLGTVAGDDTLMLAAKTPEAAQAIVDGLEALRRR